MENHHSILDDDIDIENDDDGEGGGEGVVKRKESLTQRHSLMGVVMVQVVVSSPMKAFLLE